MRRVHVRAHGALGDFLPRTRREADFEVTFELPVGLRDLVQSTGIPHVEVGRVEVDGVPAEWPSVVEGGSRIDLHPRYPLGAPPPAPRFLLDAHLGKLAGYLRLVGIDSTHDPVLDDPDLVALSRSEDRILLTRDRGLLMHGALRRGTYVRSIEPRRQAAEVVARFALGPMLRPFTRCMACNGALAVVRADDVVDRVPAGVAERHQEFQRCCGCRRVYWEGSHHRRLSDIVAQIVPDS